MLGKKTKSHLFQSAASHPTTSWWLMSPLCLGPTPNPLCWYSCQSISYIYLFIQDYLFVQSRNWHAMCHLQYFIISMGYEYVMVIWVCILILMPVVCHWPQFVTWVREGLVGKMDLTGGQWWWVLGLKFRGGGRPWHLNVYTFILDVKLKTPIFFQHGIILSLRITAFSWYASLAVGLYMVFGSYHLKIIFKCWFCLDFTCRNFKVLHQPVIFSKSHLSHEIEVVVGSSCRYGLYMYRPHNRGT